GEAAHAPGAAGWAGEAGLLLPGSASAPVPSPALGVLPGSPAVRSAGLRRWRVPVLTPPAAAAPRLLAGLREAARGDLAFGPGLHHLLAVEAFAQRLADTGRLLPRIVERPGGTPAARWRPVLRGADAGHFRALAEALPPVALAHRPEGGEDAGGPGPVYEALCALADAAARTRLAGALSRAARSADAAALVRALAPDDAGLDRAGAGTAAALRSWHRRTEDPRGAARLLFRLVEPDREGRTPGAPEVWRVEFWVRSSADPSLQLPLSEMWLGEGGAWLPDDVESLVLRDLERAARHYPPIRDELA